MPCQAILCRFLRNCPLTNEQMFATMGLQVKSCSLTPREHAADFSQWKSGTGRERKRVTLPFFAYARYFLFQRSWRRPDGNPTNFRLISDGFPTHFRRVWYWNPDFFHGIIPAQRMRRWSLPTKYRPFTDTLPTVYLLNYRPFSCYNATAKSRPD